MTEEIWKTVEDFPDYQISNLGRVKSIKYGRERILKGWRHSGGYLAVTLCGERINKKKFVHSLVLETFVGPCPKGYETGHLDGNPANDRLDNLDWITPSENQRMNYQVFESSALAKITLADAREIRRLYATGGYTYKALGRRFGVTHSTIGRVIKGIIWKE